MCSALPVLLLCFNLHIFSLFTPKACGRFNEVSVGQRVGGGGGGGAIDWVVLPLSPQCPTEVSALINSEGKK